MADADRERRLQEVLLSYLRGIDAGVPPDREGLLRRHPDLADELRTFFADQDRFDRLAAPLRRERQPAGLGRVPYFGDFELLEEIARGGMGVVYKARQNSLQRVVALKMMSAGTLATPEEQERFRKESTEAAGLDHPNIVPVYEVGNREGQAYFTMKYFPDGNLVAHLPQLRQQPREAARILATVARAVDHAHRHGVLHRDLKPANILLAKRGHSSFSSGGEKDECPLFEPHVTDFGLAKRVAGDSGVTQSGLIVGTPSYMSPEQAAGKGSRLCPASDVYALGSILYECLTGRPPFRGESPLGTLMQVIHEEPTPPRRVNPKADCVLESICLKCLEKDPARRYSSAAKLADDLECWLRGEPVSVRRGWWSRRRWPRKRLALVAGLLLVVTLLGCCGALSVVGVAELAAKPQRDRAVAALEQALHAEMLAREQKSKAEALDRAQQLLYAQQLYLAQREWEDKKFEQAQALLDKAPDRRGWEWYYLRRQLRGAVFKLEDGAPAKGDDVREAVFNPDGSRVALVHAGGRVRYWDTVSGKLVSDDPPTRVPTTALVYSPDNRRLAVGDRDGRVTVRDRTGVVQMAFRAHRQQVTRLTWSPDGKYLATAGGEDEASGSARLWNAIDGELVAEFAHGRMAAHDLAFSPDNRFVAAAGGDGAARVWNVPEGRQVFSARGGVALAWRPDGHALAVAESNPAVTLWSVLRWRAATKLTLPSPPVALAFAPGSVRLATLGRDGGVKVWDAADGVELLTLGSGSRFLAFSPDGRLLASGTKDGGVQFWDATPEKDTPGTMKKAD